MEFSKRNKRILAQACLANGLSVPPATSAQDMHKMLTGIRVKKSKPEPAVKNTPTTPLVYAEMVEAERQKILTAFGGSSESEKQFIEEELDRRWKKASGSIRIPNDLYLAKIDVDDDIMRQVTSEGWQCIIVDKNGSWYRKTQKTEPTQPPDTNMEEIYDEAVRVGSMPDAETATSAPVSNQGEATHDTELVVPEAFAEIIKSCRQRLMSWLAVNNVPQAVARMSLPSSIYDDLPISFPDTPSSSASSSDDISRKMIARLAGQIFPDTLTPETLGVLNKEEKIIAQNRTLWSDEETKDFSPHKEFTDGSGIILGMQRIVNGHKEIVAFRQIVRDGVPCKGMELKWVPETPEVLDEVEQLKQSWNDDAESSAEEEKEKEEAKDDTANKIEKPIAVSDAPENHRDVLEHASDAVTPPVETAIFKLIADPA